MTAFDRMSGWSLKQWSQALKSVGYYPTHRVLQANLGIFHRRTIPGIVGGAQAMLLEGPPGVGKTFLGESLATLAKGTPLIYQFHAWSDDADLYAGVNVQAAVAGKAKEVTQLGVLARAACLTVGKQRTKPLTKQERAKGLAGGGPVVLILDEVDKAPERVEALLLDYLQSGRVPIKPGVHLQTDLTKLIVVITSNDMRPLTEAFLRRVRRVQVGDIPASVRVDLMARKTGYNANWIKAVHDAVGVITEAEGSILSLQEEIAALVEIATLDPSWSDRTQAIAYVMESWVAREAAGRGLASKAAGILVQLEQTRGLRPTGVGSVTPGTTPRR